RSECLFSTYRGAPDALIDRIHRFFKIHGYSMFFKVGDLLFAAQLKIPYGSDDLHIRYDGLEDHIKSYLVVAGTGTAMGDSGGLDFLGIFCQRFSLQYSFCADRKWIGLVFKYVSKNQVLDHLLIIGFSYIQYRKRSHFQKSGPFFNLPEFFFTKSTGIYQNSMDFKAFFKVKMKGAKSGVQSAAIG